MSNKIRECPFCGVGKLKNCKGDFHFEPPQNVPGGEIVIQQAKWSECDNCGEQILPHELDQAIDVETCRRLGLLTPFEIREIRSRTGLSAVDMASLLGVGAKTYTRWESGKSFQNKSSDNLIRLLDRDAESFGLIEAERNPDRNNQIVSYFNNLPDHKGNNSQAMATHSGNLDEENVRKLYEKLKRMASPVKKNNK